MQLEDLPVIELTGTPYERGLIHGESMREQIKEVFWGWQYMVEKVTSAELQRSVDHFCVMTKFAEAMEEWTPDLLAELAGISDGSGISFDALYMFNCTDENQWFLEHRERGLEMPEGRGCSSLGAVGDIARIGQNMDIPGATDGFQVLLHILEDEAERESYVFSLAGMLGMIGVSSAPVGVVNNSLKQLNQRIDGLPVNVVTRGLLMQDSFQAARDFITQAPHATGHNWIICGEGSDEVATFECSAAGAVELPAHEGGTHIHTNHPLINEDLHVVEDFRTARSTSNTHSRLTDLEQTVLGAGNLGVAEMKAALSSHADEANPVCRHVTDRGTNFTAGCVVYEMTAPARLHFSPGPPCETAFGQWVLDHYELSGAG